MVDVETLKGSGDSWSDKDKMFFALFVFNIRSRIAVIGEKIFIRQFIQKWGDEDKSVNNRTVASSFSKWLGVSFLKHRPMQRPLVTFRSSFINASVRITQLLKYSHLFSSSTSTYARTSSDRSRTIFQWSVSVSPKMDARQE